MLQLYQIARHIGRKLTTMVCSLNDATNKLLYITYLNKDKYRFYHFTYQLLRQKHYTVQVLAEFAAQFLTPVMSINLSMSQAISK